MNRANATEIVHAWDEEDPSIQMAAERTRSLCEVSWPSLAVQLGPQGVVAWGEYMVELGYLTHGSYTLNQAMLKNGEVKKRDDMVAKTISRFLYEFARNKDDAKDIYWRKRIDGETAPFVRVPVTRDVVWLRDKVSDLYEVFFKMSPVSEVKACVENVLQSVRKDADLANGLWYTCENLFWDAESCALVESPDLGGKQTYKEIGSTSRTKGIDPSLIKKEFSRWTTTFESYTGKEWNSFYEELPMEYDFMKVWANEGSKGWVDRYWDTCIAVSTNFMYNKPPIMYILKGKTRNGKSAFVSHLHGLIGRHQTTDLTLPDLADWSLNNALFGSLMNAPDEDLAGELNAKATAAFKTISAKTEMKVPVKYSSIPLRVTPHFMIFDPRNDPPAFFGDPIPCMKRIRFIFFLNDLTKMDNKPVHFWEEVFIAHPKMLSKYVGFLLALAKYFSEHEMWYSKTMMASSDYMAETIASTTLYYRYFTTFYAGFESWDILKRDYANFCRERGYKPNGEEVLRQEFFQEGQNYKKRYYAGTKEKTYMYISGDNYTTATYDKGRGKHILCKREPFYEYGTAGDAITAGISCVDYLAKKADGEVEESIMKTKPLEGVL